MYFRGEGQGRRDVMLCSEYEAECLVIQGVVTELFDISQLQESFIH